MYIHETMQSPEVTTPMGKGTIWLIKEYSEEAETLYSVVISEGEHRGCIFDFRNKDIRFDLNYSLGRGKWSELKRRFSEANPVVVLENNRKHEVNSNKN